MILLYSFISDFVYVLLLVFIINLFVSCIFVVLWLILKLVKLLHRELKV